MVGFGCCERKIGGKYIWQIRYSQGRHPRCRGLCISPSSPGTWQCPLNAGLWSQDSLLMKLSKLEQREHELTKGNWYGKDNR